MNSEEWQEKRDERLAISHYRCSACPSTTKLTVHHLTYRRVKNEDMADLLPLCVSCHEEIERIIKDGKISRTGNPLWLATESVRLIMESKKKPETPLKIPETKADKRLNKNSNAARVQRELVTIDGFIECVQRYDRRSFKREVKKIIGFKSNRVTNAFAIYERYKKTGNFLMPGRE